MTMTVEKRRKIERMMVRKLLRMAITAGFSVTVDNLCGDVDENGHNDGHVIIKSNKVNAILDVMFSVDEERLYFYSPHGGTQWAYMVYGNDGYDVVCDHTVGDTNPVWKQLMEEYAKYTDVVCDRIFN